jgi:hypothetical protein
MSHIMFNLIGEEIEIILLHVGIRKRRFYGNAGERCLGNTHGYNKRSIE